MQKTIYQSITITLFLFILFGGIYPFIITILGKSLFTQQVNGSLIYINNSPVGSKLIGQNFKAAKYFHGRPSSAGNGYDALHSSASNLSQTNNALLEKIENSIKLVLKENPSIQKKDIPVELVTGSSSGLDPHISIESAYLQIPRIARARKIKENIIKSLVNENYEKSNMKFIGEKAVNVLELNLALDKI